MMVRQIDRTDPPARHSPRVLAVIASFGEKNLQFLHTIVRRYQAMDLAVDVVVVSEAIKPVPPGVRLVVGLPSSNPWSLPFAHKPIFAEQIDRYDVFIYSEDDIDVTEANIRAFLAATRILAPDEIAGFLRYEKNKDGSTWMPDAHDVFHWKPESVVSRGGRVFAEYSNEHAACYMITQAQLGVAIASGGFLVAPYEGKYDMLCAAATDPYTRCGFRKLVCISELPDFLLHHMSNRYVGEMGLPLSVFAEQLETLQQISDGTHPATTLCEVESQLARTEWCKGFYEAPEDALLAMVPASARTVLSIGCGWGATEARLQERGATVTALPLDSVIGAAAAKRGVRIVYGRLDEGLAQLSGQQFDCVLITNLLHLQRDPQDIFDRCAGLVAEGGSLVADSPNFARLATIAKRTLGVADLRKLRSFKESGISVFGARALTRWGRRRGLSGAEVRWYNHALPRSFGLARMPFRLGWLTANSWVFRANRNVVPSRAAVAGSEIRRDRIAGHPEPVAQNLGSSSGGTGPRAPHEHAA